MKVFSEPLHLFTLMHETIATQPHWETYLAPRILLGLWHPRFIPYAQNILPYCKRSFIGVSPGIAKEYFWDSCEVFSMNFGVLASWEGQRCVRACNFIHAPCINHTLRQVPAGVQRGGEEGDGMDGERAGADDRGDAVGRGRHPHGQDEELAGPAGDSQEYVPFSSGGHVGRGD